MPKPARTSNTSTDTPASAEPSAAPTLMDALSQLKPSVRVSSGMICAINPLPAISVGAMDRPMSRLAGIIPGTDVTNTAGRLPTANVANESR